MDVSLSPRMAEFVKKLVEGGDYLSACEVVEEALVLLEDRETFRAFKRDELRKEIAIGIEQADRGIVAPLDMDEIRAEVAARVESRQVRS